LYHKFFESEVYYFEAVKRQIGMYSTEHTANLSLTIARTMERTTGMSRPLLDCYKLPRLTRISDSVHSLLVQVSPIHYMIKSPYYTIYPIPPSPFNHTATFHSATFRITVTRRPIPHTPIPPYEPNQPIKKIYTRPIPMPTLKKQARQCTIQHVRFHANIEYLYNVRSGELPTYTLIPCRSLVR
jgi:hypothetical protein